MSTIEGGIVCTNDKKIYETVRMLRAHGMARESGDINFERKMIKKYKDLSPKFIFLFPGFNMRNNEISATIGINQLKRLDANNRKRVENFKYFLKNIDGSIYFNNFDIAGNSNYAFPLILRDTSIKLRDNLERLMKDNKIEFRRGNAGGGNQLRQPYLNDYLKKYNLKDFPNVEHVHFFGYYIGNYPSLKKVKILKIISILNSLK
jgi:CDP-6-deoxy-D-xylo-4-hexulose-3-dehydrase